MFLHPWAVAIGVIAASLPIAIHILTKPRPSRLPLSTIRFVREAIRQRRARHRLRDLLVLLARTIAILLLALALARPQLGPKPLIHEDQSAEAVRVVIVDISQSMASLDQGVTSLQRAQTIAASHLKYRPGLQANLILAGSTPHAVFDGPSQNFDALRDELSRAQVLPHRLDVNRAIALAAEMLALPTDAPQRPELVVISDFQRSNWARADFSVLPSQTRIQLESTAAAETPNNLAVLSAEIRGRAAPKSDVLLEVVIANYSSALRSVSVEVQIGDATYRLEGTCPAGRRTTLAETISFAEPGWQTGQAELAGVEDALAADNVAPLVVGVHNQAHFALITRQPSALRPSSSHFLECALVPDAYLGPQASATLERLDPADLSRESLVQADAIILDHPGKLSPEATDLLAGLLRRGKPILYVAAEAIDAANLDLLQRAAGGGLQMPVTFVPAPHGQVRQDLLLTSIRTEAPLFEVFGDRTAAMIQRWRFGGGLASQPRPEGLQDEILASYSDGSAGIVVTASDAGTFAVLNADLERSNLPITPAFVPLVDQLVRQLLQERRTASSAICGEPLVARIPSVAASADELLVRGPATLDGEAKNLGELKDDGVGTVWQWPQPTHPGVYEIVRGDETVFALPVRLAEEESPLGSLSAEVLQQRLVGTHDVHYRALDNQQQQKDVLWSWLLAGCVLCLLAELSVLSGYRN